MAGQIDFTRHPGLPQRGNIEALCKRWCACTASLAMNWRWSLSSTGAPDDSYLRSPPACPRHPSARSFLLLSRTSVPSRPSAAGLAAGQGEYFAVMAADLQEPPELIPPVCQAATRGAVRRCGWDAEPVAPIPWGSRMASALFWGFFRRCIQREIPTGGVDVLAARVPCAITCCA